MYSTETSRCYSQEIYPVIFYYECAATATWRIDVSFDDAKPVR